MAQRRMFSKDIVGTDSFLEMPISSQLLYFQLGMEADDDGFVGSPKKVARIIGAGGDDLKILSAKRFILIFPSGIVVIKHWKMNNYIQADRYHETKYTDEKNTLLIKENGSYTECIQNVSKMDTQVRLGKVSLDKSNTVFSKEKTEPTKPSAYEKDLVYEEVSTTYKKPFHIKKKRVLTDKQKAYLKNSELYQHFSKTARDLGLSVFEKESGGNAKMAKQAEHFLGIDESKKLIEHYLSSCDGKPISFKACLCEFNLINWKNKKPISYEEEKSNDYLNKFYQ